MADSITVQIKGLDQLGRALQRIPATLSTRIMREALHATGDVMKEAAELTAPVRTGALREDMIVKVRVSGDLSINYVLVGPGYDRSKLRARKHGKLAGTVDTTVSPGVYGKFLELGTKNMPPWPWLRPAFEASKEAALATFVAYIRAGLQAVIAEVRG